MSAFEHALKSASRIVSLQFCLTQLYEWHFLHCIVSYRIVSHRNREKASTTCGNRQRLPSREKRSAAFYDTLKMKSLFVFIMTKFKPRPQTLQFVTAVFVFFHVIKFSLLLMSSVLLYLIVNEHTCVPIELVQGQFPGLAISNAKIQIRFQIIYTEAILSNSTRKLLWFEISKMPIEV